MKIWKFYLKTQKICKDDTNSMDDDLDAKYPLYAYTKDKEIAKRFRDERNMDLFVESVSKTPKIEEFTFRENHPGELLEKHELRTKMDDTPFGYGHVILILTADEINEITSYTQQDPMDIFDEILDSIDNRSIPDPYIFNDEYLKLLIITGYTLIYRLSLSKLYGIGFLNEYIPKHKLRVDELRVCVRLFGGLFQVK